MATRYILMTDTQKRAELLEHGWIEKVCLEEEFYQNVLIDTYSHTMYYKGDEKLLMSLQHAYAQELTERLMKL